MAEITEDGLNFIARCSTSSAAVAAEDFLNAVGHIGFSAAACGAWAGVGRNRKSRFFFVSWPPDWLEFYEKNRFYEHDPMLVEARRRVSPFWFSEVLPRLNLAGKQRELYEAALAYGYTDVFGVPIHGPGNMQGLVSLAASRPLTFRAADRAVLEMMSRAVWERCRTAEGFGLSDMDRPRLSPREIECLQWAAAGKSDNDMATLVGIKPATAHFHIEKAKKRLGVKTRVEAVAVGLLHGVI
ncbi:MAG: LuxR family transcriptional regulator [Xanthobacteraceae bacterium]